MGACTCTRARASVLAESVPVSLCAGGFQVFEEYNIMTRSLVIFNLLMYMLLLSMSSTVTGEIGRCRNDRYCWDYPEILSHSRCREIPQ